MFFCDFRQHLPVDFYLFFLKAMDEFTIGNSVLPAGGIYLNLPKSPEGPLLSPPVPVGMGPGVEESIFSQSVFRFPPPAVSLCLLQNLLPSFVSGLAAFYPYPILEV
jgi:hypothetical protein